MPAFACRSPAINRRTSGSGLPLRFTRLRSDTSPSPSFGRTDRPRSHSRSGRSVAVTRRRPASRRSRRFARCNRYRHCLLIGDSRRRAHRLKPEKKRPPRPRRPACGVEHLRDEQKLRFDANTRTTMRLPTKPSHTPTTTGVFLKLFPRPARRRTSTSPPVFSPAHDLQQRHDLGWAEKVKAKEAFRMRGDGCNRVDVERRRVAWRDRAWFATVHRASRRPRA